jgi:hypothetical protein
MALNIKPFEGPRSPDWTEPLHNDQIDISTQGHEGEDSLENSDANLLYFSKDLKKGSKYKLKKLDIL